MLANRPLDRRRKAGGVRQASLSCSIIEATLTQLLVDPLADVRHILLTELQRLLHGEATAVLTAQDRGRKWGKEKSTSTTGLTCCIWTLAGAFLQCLSGHWRHEQRLRLCQNLTKERHWRPGFFLKIPYSCKWLRSREECVDNRTAVRMGGLTSRTKTPQSLSFFCWGIPWSNKTPQINREYSNKTATTRARTFLLVWIHGTYCTCSYMIDLVGFINVFLLYLQYDKLPQPLKQLI